MKIIYLFVFVAILSFNSCCRQIPCNQDYNALAINFNSFQKKELDTIIFRQFTKGSNFTSLIDSVIIDSTNDSLFIVNGNSTSYLLYQNQLAISNYDDYEIFVPATNTLIKIDSIVEQQTTTQYCAEGSEDACTNPVTSLNQNGIQIFEKPTLYGAQYDTITIIVNK